VFDKTKTQTLPTPTTPRPSPPPLLQEETDEEKLLRIVSKPSSFREIFEFKDDNPNVQVPVFPTFMEPEKSVVLKGLEKAKLSKEIKVVEGKLKVTENPELPEKKRPAKKFRYRAIRHKSAVSCAMRNRQILKQLSGQNKRKNRLG
jgi:hypothetical protein